MIPPVQLVAMEDKRAREAFRLRSFAGPHPALLQAEAAGICNSEPEATQQRQWPPSTRASAPRAVQPQGAGHDGGGDDGGDGLAVAADRDRIILHFDVDVSLVPVSHRMLSRACPLPCTAVILCDSVATTHNSSATCTGPVTSP